MLRTFVYSAVAFSTTSNSLRANAFSLLYSSRATMASGRAAKEGSLESLCLISKKACEIMTPMVQKFYAHCNGIDTADVGNGVRLKPDASVFTIADGIVQHLLVSHLFRPDLFRSVVGEEEDSDAGVVLTGDGPYSVDGLAVPAEFRPEIDGCREGMAALSSEIEGGVFRGLTVFIDPIDGTREFSSGKGEQCSICIGFSGADGRPVAGIVYRPIDGTYATGAASEGFLETKLNMASSPDSRGFLTSNGNISPFIEDLIERLGFERVPSGGAGNKMLMLLEGKGTAYIQDRGVSRWDTSAAQAVIEANGGILCKLSPFVSKRALEGYTYLKAETNLDFEPLANLTPYNCVEKSAVNYGDPPRSGTVKEYKAYSNLCGLLAVNDASEVNLNLIYDGIHASCAAGFIPAYD